MPERYYLTLSQLIKRLQRIEKHVGDIPVFYQNNYDRVDSVGHAVLVRADERHMEWEDDEIIKEGEVICEIQQ